MEKTPYYIIQRDGHVYMFFDYRTIYYKTVNELTIVTLMVQYHKGNAFKRIKLILRTIASTNVDEINGKL